MNETVVFSLIMLASVFMASYSQILLKIAANAQYKSKLSEYLNVRVIGAYMLFAVSATVGMLVLRHIQLSLASVLEASGYINVAVLSTLLLKERLCIRQIGGILMIILGIVLFAL